MIWPWVGRRGLYYRADYNAFWITVTFGPLSVGLPTLSLHLPSCFLPFRYFIFTHKWAYYTYGFACNIYDPLQCTEALLKHLWIFEDYQYAAFSNTGCSHLEGVGEMSDRKALKVLWACYSPNWEHVVPALSRNTGDNLTRIMREFCNSCKISCQNKQNCSAAWDRKTRNCELKYKHRQQYAVATNTWT